MSDPHCVDGRLMRHDPQPDDPYLQIDIGTCGECEGEGCDRMYARLAVEDCQDTINAALEDLESELKRLNAGSLASVTIGVDPLYVAIEVK
jgi:CO dehydrogenase/acetyl-CoA synthase gamma subunit (corrinoid Fe-S protein)